MGGGGLLEVEVVLDPDESVLKVSGEIDVSTVEDLQRCLAQVTSPAVAVDLNGVTFMGSVGVAALLHALGDGVRVRVVNASTQARRMLELSGSWELLNGD